ncbi:MAG: DEAD/DEAH box helicase [Verrucomicrobia bacterium]|nr:DEAD/DEAH box helicase [Verrucomicrobiota bacterium]
MRFDQFGFEQEILRAIGKVGYEKPTPVQTAAIPKAMQGHDLITIAQTGTGKTAAFAWPLLHRLAGGFRAGKVRGLRALILAPTRELALQIAESVRSYGRHLPVRVAAIHGGVDEFAQIRSLRKGAHIVVATPGRLLDLLENERMDLRGVDYLVLDEADRMLDMGFLPDIETIVSQLPKRRQTLMFSATFPREVESLARRFLREPKLVQIGRRSNPAETVDQAVYEVPAHLKGPLLLELLRMPRFRRVLVFVKMKEGADRLTGFLEAAGVRVAKLHSSRSQDQRLAALQRFKNGEVQVLVATDIMARGMDIEGVSQVVNYDFPVNPEDYIHRIGRTGRAEARGEAVSFVPPEDLNLLGILELFIGERLSRRRIQAFDYRAPKQPRDPLAAQPIRDWRKRTREAEAKRAAQPAAKPKPAAPPPARKGKQENRNRTGPGGR